MKKIKLFLIITLIMLSIAGCSENIEISVNEDSPKTINVKKEVKNVSEGYYGTVKFNGKSITYTPNPNFNGSDSFSYNIGNKVVQVSVTVEAVNDVPEAVNDEITVMENRKVTINVLKNDIDLDNDKIIIENVTKCSNGTITRNDNDSFTYEPNKGYSGKDKFTYTITDGIGGTSSATVSITITKSNHDPVAVNDKFKVSEDEKLKINILENDYDNDNDSLIIQSITQPSNGTVLKNSNNTLTYKPNVNYNGKDVFTYKINDGHGSTSSATVSITVDPVNDPPEVVDDVIELDEDKEVIIKVLENDFDVDDDSLEIESITEPSNGSVTINEDNTLTYIPNENYNGEDEFTYIVNDGSDETSTATVFITINPINDAPKAVNDEVKIAGTETVSINVLINDVDIDNDVLSIESVIQGTYGSVSINDDKTITYTPGSEFIAFGEDSFEYVITDGNGETSTASVTVKLSD